jgi:hypothetical protein
VLTVGLAGIRHDFERPFQFPQACDFSTDIGEVTKRHLPRVGSGHVTAIGKCMKRTNIIEREAEFTTAPYEAQPLHMSLIIQAVPPRAAWWRWQKSHALVIPDGLDIDPGCFGEPANRQWPGSRPCLHCR